MGRKAVGEGAMSTAERMRRYREKMKTKGGKPSTRARATRADVVSAAPPPLPKVEADAVAPHLPPLEAVPVEPPPSPPPIDVVEAESRPANCDRLPVEISLPIAVELPLQPPPPPVEADPDPVEALAFEPGDDMGLLTKLGRGSWLEGIKRLDSVGLTSKACAKARAVGITVAELAEIQRRIEAAEACQH